jgi:endo-1,4-beta-mannosidase
MARFLLGVNYWPRTSAMAMWTRFDLGEIDDDFARIAGLGLDVVRFFLLWEAFQPEPDAMSQTALDRFEAVLERASAHGLRTMPTLFTGHMSGVNWLPAWTLDPAHRNLRFRTFTRGGESPFGIGDFYTGELLDAQRVFARAVGERAREHAALFLWDLGNEFSNLRAPRSPRDAEHWSAALTHDLFESSNVGATGGLHGEDVTFERNIRPSSIAEPWEVATMHGYPVYSPFARDRADAEVVPFLCELAASCAHKRVLFSEFGNPTCPPGGHAAGGYACLSEDEMAVYAHRVLDRLQHRGALGAFWWCWADYAPALAATPPFDRAPHELSFGIVRGDGSEKPVARALAAFGRERREVAAASVAIVDEAAYYDGLPASLAVAYDAYCEAHALTEEVS